MTTYDAIDCQGFAGGFTLGMVQAGFHLVAKREHAAGFGAVNCENNRHLLGYDWETQRSEGAEWEPVDAEVVFGNPPCSGFSVASNTEFRGANSPINHCMWDLINYAARVRPQIVAFESVQPAVSREDGRAMMRALHSHLEDLTGETWNLHHVKHDAYALGNCAIRRRYFWVASRIPFGVEMTTNSTFPTFWDAIGDLADLDLAWETQPYRIAPASTWVRDQELRSAADAVDGMATTTWDGSNPYGSRLHAILDHPNVDWQQGDTLEVAVKKLHESHGVPDLWKPRIERLQNKEWRSGFFPTVRWHAHRPARVIYGGSSNNVVHPFLDRTITHREVARVMGFPDDWRIEPLRDARGAESFWGKGITVQCGRWLGEWIKAALDGEPGSYAGEPAGDREWMIDIKSKKPKKENR